MAESPNRSIVSGPGVRDPQTGRYLPGHAPTSKGRPPRAKELEYLRTTAAVCTQGDWEEIVGKATAQAKRGNKDARKWLSDMLLGRDPISYFQLVLDQRPDLRVEELEELLKRYERLYAQFSARRKQVTVDVEFENESP